MSDPQAAPTWPLVPHTAAKLGLLAAYLEPWFAILSQGGFPHVVYVDGFAGPGRYSGGEDGSPIVALKALAAHGQRLQSAFEFHFVERDRRTVEALNANIEMLRKQGLISSSTSIIVHPRQSFEEAYDQAIAPRLAQLAGVPAFVLVDPFGWTGIPMRIMADLMKRPRAELLVNFMFEEINRFLRGCLETRWGGLKSANSMESKRSPTWSLRCGPPIPGQNMLVTTSAIRAI